MRDELRAALDVIAAAAANLRHYSERLSPEDHAATVADIEQAAEQIAVGLAAEPVPTTAVLKRRAR